jgi:hypothetical protein
MVIQIMVLATQNEAPAADQGVATSTVTFFRTIGGSVGVSIFGALFASRLTHLLGSRVPETMTPDTINQLPDDQRAQVAGAFADAITNVFLWAVPLVLLGWTLIWLLKKSRCARRRVRPAVPRRAPTAAGICPHLPSPTERTPTAACRPLWWTAPGHERAQCVDRRGAPGIAGGANVCGHGTRTAAISVRGKNRAYRHRCGARSPQLAASPRRQVDRGT